MPNINIVRVSSPLAPEVQSLESFDVAVVVVTTKGICKISCGHPHCDGYCLCEMMQRDLSQHDLIPLVCSALVRIRGGVLPRIYMCWSQSLESHLHRYMSLSVRLRNWCRVQVAGKVGSHVFCVTLGQSDGDSGSFDSCPGF